MNERRCPACQSPTAILAWCDQGTRVECFGCGYNGPPLDTPLNRRAAQEWRERDAERDACIAEYRAHKRHMTLNEVARDLIAGGIVNPIEAASLLYGIFEDREDPELVEPRAVGRFHRVMLAHYYYEVCAHVERE